MFIYNISHEYWFTLLTKGHLPKRLFRKECFIQYEDISNFLETEGWEIHHIFGKFEYEDDERFFIQTSEEQGEAYTIWDGY